MVRAGSPVVEGLNTGFLLSGEDRFGNWELDPESRFDLDSVGLAALHHAQNSYRNSEHHPEAKREKSG